MPEYIYFPAQYDGKIKTLLLDANITGHLDSIAKRGSSYQDPVVRRRMTDMVDRLDSELHVMPGLGAAESVIRRGVELRETTNYHRRGENAMRLLVDDHTALRAWLNGDEPEHDPHDINGNEYTNNNLDSDLTTVRNNFVVPSYAMILKAYQLYLQRRDALSSFRELEAFADELFARGSRELMLGALLLTGNSAGREVALNIMKLREQHDIKSTLDRLWNTSFDLTYSRIARMPSLPELRNVIAQPAVFVTDDRHLGKFLQMIEPAGAIAMQRGGGMTADSVTLEPFIDTDLLDGVTEVVRRSNEKALRESADIQMIQRIRKYKSRVYAGKLEDWLDEDTNSVTN